MKEKILNNCELLVDETIGNIQKMIAIDSVRNEEAGTEGKPLGPGIDLAFDEFLNLCASIGMRTYKDKDGKYAYAEIGPEDGQLFGILGHLDVVPVGDLAKWTEAEPFSGKVVDEKIIGRGSLDDKGPVVIAFMALKNLVDLGYNFKSRVRIIVGGAEETTWECIDKYKEEQEIPVVSFSPDAEFPLINAEKSLLQFNLSDNFNGDFEIIAGNAYNAVCDEAIYQGPQVDDLITELEKLNYQFEKNNDGSITVLGETAHAKDCNLGVNAISHLCIALYNIGIHSPAIDFIATRIQNTYYGELLLNEVIEDQESGHLTLNLAKLHIKDGKEVIGFDSRIPVTVDEDQIISKYQTIAKELGFEYEQIDLLRKLFVPESSDLVQTLMKIYKEITKDEDAKPLSSGGATYSRAWGNCVAYGMVFERQHMIERMHKPNECLEIKFIVPALQIYSLAIYELDQIKF